MFVLIFGINPSKITNILICILTAYLKYYYTIFFYLTISKNLFAKYCIIS